MTASRVTLDYDEVIHLIDMLVVRIAAGIDTPQDYSCYYKLSAAEKRLTRKGVST